MADDVLGGSLQSQGTFLSLQQIFDKALNGLRAQGGPSADPGTNRCSYRTKRNGQVRACGVGQLIPDNVYDSYFDHGLYSDAEHLLSDESFRDALIAGGVDARDEEVQSLIISLQQAHDCATGSLYKPNPDAEFMVSFEARMKRLAEHFDLTYTEAAP